MYLKYRKGVCQLLRLKLLVVVIVANIFLVCIFASTAPTQITPVATITTPRVTSLAWSSDSSAMAIGYSNGAVSIWVITDDDTKPLSTISFMQPGHSVTALAFNSAVSRLSVGYDDGQVQVWDLTEDTHFTLDGGTDYIKLLVWSNDDSKLASVTPGYTMIWNAELGNQLAILSEDFITLIWNQTDDIIIGKIFMGGIAIYELKTMRTMYNIPRSGAISLSPDGISVAIGAGNEIEIWNTLTGQFVSRCNGGHRSGITSMAWNSDGRLIASGGGTLGNDYTVRIWNTETGNEQATLLGHEDVIISLMWYPDSNYVLSISFDDTARVWNAEDGELLGAFDILEVYDTSRIWISPNGRLIANVGADGTVYIWDVAVRCCD